MLDISISMRDKQRPAGAVAGLRLHVTPATIVFTTAIPAAVPEATSRPILATPLYLPHRAPMAAPPQPKQKPSQRIAAPKPAPSKAATTLRIRPAEAPPATPSRPPGPAEPLSPVVCAGPRMPDIPAPPPLSRRAAIAVDPRSGFDSAVSPPAGKSRAAVCAAVAFRAARTVAAHQDIAALPLSSRLRADFWTSQIVLLKAKSVSVPSAGDTMPFGVTHL